MTKDTHLLTAEPRTITGRKVKKLRAQGIVPANIFGSKVKSTSIQLNIKDFLKLYHQVGDTGLIELTVKGQKTSLPVLVHKLQVHPVNDQLIHVDLRQVDLKEKITAEVPIELIGEAPAVEKEGGILVQLLDHVEVEALPTDFPEKIEISIENLKEINDTLHLSDLKIDTKKLTFTSEPETLIAKIEAQKEEEEEPAPETAEVEGGETKEGETTTDTGKDKPSEEKKDEDKKEDASDKPSEQNNT